MGGLAILCSDFLGGLFKAQVGEFFEFIIGFPVFLLMVGFAVTAAALVSAKAALSAALTLVASPFVLLAHLITSASRNELMKELHGLSVKVCEVVAEEREVSGRMQSVKVMKVNDQSQRLQDFMSDNSDADAGFDFSSSAIVCPVPGGEKLDDEANPRLGIYDSEDYCYHGKLRAIIEITPENKEGISALLQTNFFKTTSKLERGLHPNVFKSPEKQLDDDLVPAIAAQIGLAM